MRRVVTLLTDFGTADGYVGEMKGVILSQTPDVQLIDISHDIPPQDVERARLTLARVWRRFPRGTIHIVVVDPGVGSSRAALAVESDGRFLVGPDNGVLSAALLAPGVRAIELTVPASASATFHGRDVFAPAAAALARGESLDALGRPASSPLIRRTAEPKRISDDAVQGEIILIDRFGNAVTNLIASRGGTIEIGPRRIPIRYTYAEANVGEAVAVVGSTGLIEIAVRDGNAADVLGLKKADPVIHRVSR